MTTEDSIHDQLISFGTIISKCSTENVVNKLKCSNRFSPGEDFKMMIDHLKEYITDDMKGLIAMPSSVIFVTKYNTHEDIKESVIGEVYVYVVSSTMNKLVKKYSDESNDIFHHIIFNPVTIIGDIDIDTACAEIFSSMLIEYMKINL